SESAPSYDDPGHDYLCSDTDRGRGNIFRSGRVQNSACFVVCRIPRSTRWHVNRLGRLDFDNRNCQRSNVDRAKVDVRAGGTRATSRAVRTSSFALSHSVILHSLLWSCLVRPDAVRQLHTTGGPVGDRQVVPVRANLSGTSQTKKNEKFKPPAFSIATWEPHPLSWSHPVH